MLIFDTRNKSENINIRYIVAEKNGVYSIIFFIFTHFIIYFLKLNFNQAKKK